MKYCNICFQGRICLCCEINGVLYNLTESGFNYSMEDIIKGNPAAKALPDVLIPVTEAPNYSNVITQPAKLLCVGLNYKAHAAGANMGTVMDSPILFSKFFDALAPCGADITLPEWETTYDYEAELVIVMGKSAWAVSEAEAYDCIFGYTAGNDLSCRAAQKRSSQWLIGKTMPGFGPCGPYIVTKDEINPENGVTIKSYVNGELRQNGSTEDMIFSCSEIVSYASKYTKLEPGDLIFTGTPAGVQLENGDKAKWLKQGDSVDVFIEGIGTLTNRMI